MTLQTNDNSISSQRRRPRRQKGTGTMTTNDDALTMMLSWRTASTPRRGPAPLSATMTDSACPSCACACTAPPTNRSSTPKATRARLVRRKRSRILDVVDNNTTTATTPSTIMILHSLLLILLVKLQWNDSSRTTTMMGMVDSYSFPPPVDNIRQQSQRRSLVSSSTSSSCLFMATTMPTETPATRSTKRAADGNDNDGNSSNSKAATTMTTNKGVRSYTSSSSSAPPTRQQQQTKTTTAGQNDNGNTDNQKPRKRKKYKKYQRKRAIPESEKEIVSLKRIRQAEYEQVMGEAAADSAPQSAATSSTAGSASSVRAGSIPSATAAAASTTSSTTTTTTTTTKPPQNKLWIFERLFPAPMWDELAVQRDLFAVKEQDSDTAKKQRVREKELLRNATMGRMGSTIIAEDEIDKLKKMKNNFFGGSVIERMWRRPQLSSADLPYGPPLIKGAAVSRGPPSRTSSRGMTTGDARNETTVNAGPTTTTRNVASTEASGTVGSSPSSSSAANGDGEKIDYGLTRMVEDRIYGYRRGTNGQSLEYETSLMDRDGAVRFRDGVRLSHPLRVNADRLTYFAKKELQQRRVEEAVELYEMAVNIDPTDGRAYLGLSRCAQRRNDFKLAKEYLKQGIRNSVISPATVPGAATGPNNAESGVNPYLLQALGVLEEKMGCLAEAEASFIAAVKSRPCHAAAWVALGQLRTRKLGRSANAGRVCFKSAEQELDRAGLKPSAHVYTAWAALEYEKASDVKRARKLFKRAIEVDPKCSAAWLQLGVMEANCENWDAAQTCFDTVLTFDQRNTRVLQAYAIMETKRPEGDSRFAIDLFERALKQNPRDAGVLQPYALYVAELGDIESARDLLHRGTKVNKRHAACWQAWGVLEMKQGDYESARNIFQDGIWSCAQLSGCQSGGQRCTRLWQGWGVLEVLCHDYAAARRCFSRALDADSRNVPAITAWAQMEEMLGNFHDARFIFERALQQFSPGSADKLALWRTFELMEQRLGNVAAAQQVYERAMRESMTLNEEEASSASVLASDEDLPPVAPSKGSTSSSRRNKRKNGEEVEVSRWDKDGSLGSEVWMNDRAIEYKMPPSYGKSKRTRSQQRRRDS